MSDSYSHFENAAIRALQSENATEDTDRLAQLLLESAGQGRQQMAINQVTLGDLSKTNGLFKAETIRADQSEANLRVQQAVGERNMRDFDEQIGNAANKVAKAMAGKQKALDNLRPAYRILTDVHARIVDEDLSNKELGRVLRNSVAFIEAAL